MAIKRHNDFLANVINGIRTSVVSNGSFDAGTTGWTATASTLAAVSGGVGSTTLLQVTNSGAAVGSTYQDIATDVNSVYDLTVYFKKGTGTGGRVKVGTTSDPVAILTSPTYTDAALTKKRLSFVATATTTRITLENNDSSSGTTSLFDNLIINRTYNGYFDAFDSVDQGFKIQLFSGSMPASANTGVPLTQKIVTITLNGDGVTGLAFAESASRRLSKPSADTWSGSNINTATVNATFAILSLIGDDTTANNSTTSARYMYDIATSGAAMNIANTSFEPAAPNVWTEWNMDAPT